jgi:hypothetical protein
MTISRYMRARITSFMAMVAGRMDAPAPLSPEILASLPPAVVALLEYLTARVAELEAKQGIKKAPANSSLPPSATHPHDKPATPNKPKSTRKRGGQE